LYWEKALALDPNSASLNAMLGFLHAVDARFGWWDDRETALGKARAYGALELDPRNADASITSSCFHLMRGSYDEAVADARRAVALAPGSADVASLAGFVFTPSGYPEEAVMQNEKAIALNPNYPPMYLGMLGDSYRQVGRTEDAIAAFKAYHARSPGFGLTDLVIIYQESGRPEEVTRTAGQLLAARPNFTIAAWLKTQFVRRDKARVEADAAALRAAGLPTG
jgi:adenylate cyclase